MKRSMLLFALSTALAAGVIAAGVITAGVITAGVITARAIAAEPEPQPNEEAAVKAVADAYIAAYNRGDAKALANLWSEKGDWITPAGRRHGREAIENNSNRSSPTTRAGSLKWPSRRSASSLRTWPLTRALSA